MVLRKDYPYILLAIALSVLGAVAVADPSDSVATYALLGLVGVSVIMAIMINPSLGANVLIIAVFSNVSKILTDMGLPGVIKPLVAIVFVAILVRNYYVGGIPLNRPRTSRAETFLLAYLFAVTASLLVASDRDLALERVIDLVKDMVIIYCILFSLRRLEEWERAVFIIVLVITLLSLPGLYQAATGNYTETFFGFARVSGPDNRIAGPVNEPNFWGQVLVSVIPFAIFGFLRESSVKKLVYALLLAILLIELLNTYSRGAYLAFLVCMFFIVFFFTRFNIVFVSSVLGIAILALPFLPASYKDRFQTISFLTPATENGIYADSSFRGRSSEILAGLIMFADHPILGVGAANYPINYQDYAELIGLEFRTEQREAHSLYVETLAETGIVGGLTFGGILVSAFLAFSRIKKEVAQSPAHQKWTSHISSIQASIIAYLVASTFLHGASYIRYLWVLLSLGLTLVNLLYEDISDPHKIYKKNTVKS